MKENFASRRSIVVRQALSWIVVCAGFVLGVLSLVMSGQVWLIQDSNSQVWLTSGFRVAGPFLFGLVFVIGSLTAARNRKRARWIFFAGAPFAAFVLSYPSAGYLLWGSDGSGTFHLPRLSTAIGLSSLFYLPFVASLIVVRNRRRALQVFVITALIVAPVLIASRWTAGVLPPLAVWSVPFSAFGCFWLATGRRHWPDLLRPRPRSATKRVSVVAVELLATFALVVTGTFTLAAIRSSLFTGDCRGPSLFIRPLGPEHVVFTARIVRAGHSVKVSGRWAGGWAIGLVEEHFWGLPPWAPHLVLLTNSLFLEGETFFVSGLRGTGLLTRLLPIVDASTCGSHYTLPLAQAKMALQLLRRPPPLDELRVMGFVRSRLLPAEQKEPRPRSGYEPSDLYGLYFTPPVKDRLLAGVKVRVTSSAESTVVTTDRDGMYVAAVLRPDDYSFRLLDVPANQIAKDRRLAKADLVRDGRVHLDIYADWNGSIEGRIRDAAGGPAQAGVELQNADGTRPGPGSYSRTRDGRFQFETLVPGTRCLLLINPFGSSDESPYPRMYFPGVTRREDARVLEIRGDNHIRDLDIVLHRLERRNLRAHVSWSNGKPAYDAWVYVAYEGADAYQNVTNSLHYWTTDGAGTADLHLFSNSRVRVQATKSIDADNGPPSYVTSNVVELDTNALPRDLSLVLNASK